MFNHIPPIYVFSFTRCTHIYNISILQWLRGMKEAKSMQRIVCLLGTCSDYVLRHPTSVCDALKKNKNGGLTHFTKLGRLLLNFGPQRWCRFFKLLCLYYTKHLLSDWAKHTLAHTHMDTRTDSFVNKRPE